MVDRVCWIGNLECSSQNSNRIHINGYRNVVVRTLNLYTTDTILYHRQILFLEDWYCFMWSWRRYIFLPWGQQRLPLICYAFEHIKIIAEAIDLKAESFLHKLSGLFKQLSRLLYTWYNTNWAKLLNTRFQKVTLQGFESQGFYRQAYAKTT